MSTQHLHIWLIELLLKTITICNWLFYVLVCVEHILFNIPTVTISLYSAACSPNTHQGRSILEQRAQYASSSQTTCSGTTKTLGTFSKEYICEECGQASRLPDAGYAKQQRPLTYKQYQDQVYSSISEASIRYFTFTVLFTSPHLGRIFNVHPFTACAGYAHSLKYRVTLCPFGREYTVFC